MKAFESLSYGVMFMVAAACFAGVARVAVLFVAI